MRTASKTSASHTSSVGGRIGALPCLLPLVACAPAGAAGLHLLSLAPHVAAVAVGDKAAGTSGAFDHGSFDRTVKAYVDDQGRVDYAGLSKHTDDLNAYIASLATVRADKLGRDEKLALLINAYNAFTLRLILDYYPVASIKDIPAGKRWKDRRWRIGSKTYSLDDIEHEQIRPVFDEPRIHFALVCAAVGCPPLRREAYVVDRLDAQLDAQSRYVHTHDRWFKMTTDGSVVYLTRLYKWYGSDFEQSAGSVLSFAARYVPRLAKVLSHGHEPDIKWRDYDWSLNAQPGGASVNTNSEDAQ